MIVVYHQNNKVVEVIFEKKNIAFSAKSIANNLFDLALKFPDTLIIWCRADLKQNVNYSKMEDIFHHKKILATYSLTLNFLLTRAIGYVDESAFANLKRDVSYGTWQMSSDIGGIHSSILIILKDDIVKDINFNYFLHSLAKLAMPAGLLCYSEPSLLKDCSDIHTSHKTNNFLLFRFVKQHYRTRWVFLLLLNFFLYENRMLLFPLIISFFYKKRNLNHGVLDKIKLHSIKKVIDKKSVDVIIPTIGRKKYLYDFLKDLSNQLYLPENVIIIEQNPDLNSKSELDYLFNENWLFQIKHSFIHQAGACNARNLALRMVESEWVFMADDDIRIEDDFLEEALSLIELEGIEQINFGCFEPNYPESKKYKKRFQWANFGSGCSIVKSINTKEVFYNESFEFGYGEDSDYGMQLRNLGFDILYSPKPEILHLKAPIGGFRKKPILAWQDDIIQPKPSPTVMLYKILNLTQTQINGYKTVLFFKFYKVQSIKNPFKYMSNFKKQWERSVYWANKLNNN